MFGVEVDFYAVLAERYATPGPGSPWTAADRRSSRRRNRCREPRRRRSAATRAYRDAVHVHHAVDVNGTLRQIGSMPLATTTGVEGA